LYLKRLEIVGFKSFADTFELEFQPGISCIVGPNGCGKSNIADAIRWALGSQSPTQLRADRMEDVIFSGTVGRKPLGMAEVILTFDNSQRELDLDFDEITVTRRLFRSGDSEYLLNGNRCRLMDITDLIVDRGLGSNGYWMLERNMTETIIESGPADRRFLFDEAAGIVKYKMQRHRAELKLSAAGSDLERLDDIISEVERNVAVLGKQVRAFRRWEKAERIVAEINGLLEYKALESSRSRLEVLTASLNKSRSEEQKLQAKVAAVSARQSEARVSLEKAQTRLDSEHANCARLDSELGEIREKIAVAQERQRNTRIQIEESRGEAAELKGRAEELGSRTEILRKEREGSASRLEELKSAADRARDASASLDKERAGASSALEKVRGEYRLCAQQIQDLQDRHDEEIRRRAAARQELEHARERVSQLTVSLSRIEEEMAISRDALSGISTRRTELESALADFRKALETAREESADISQRLKVLEIEAGMLKARIGSLRSPSGGGDDDHSRRISSQLSVKEGYGLAVGAWLDSFQDSILLDSRELPEVADGSRFSIDVPGVQRPAMPEEAVWLPDCLSGDSDPRFRRLLSRCIVAPDRHMAAQWIASGTDLDIVTPDGDLMRRDGLTRLGIQESGAGSIERDALAADAEKSLQTVQERIEDLKASLEGKSSQLREIEGRIAVTMDETRTCEKDEASKRATLAGMESGFETLSTELQEISGKIPALQAIADMESDERSGDTAEEYRNRLSELGAAVELAEKNREDLVSRLNEAVREENSAMMALSSLESAISQLDADIDRSVSDSSAAAVRSQQLLKRAEELESTAGETEQALERLEERRKTLSNQREDAEKSRTEASQERAHWLESAREIESELAQNREQLSAAREERAKNSGELESLKARVDELSGRDQVLPDESSRYWSLASEDLHRELVRQTGYREDLGPVNMLAVPEHDEAQKRLTFLTEQREDLNGARDSLLQAIEEINRTAAAKFDETFVHVREHFKNMFTSLFGGGEADIMALESEDPLEGGVQIVARPPGKKLENITALSSGERAMTAAALLFALYLVKPSPFCVLDELDAPLDDTNVDNYVRLLQSFVHRTQFVVITHNKRTMEAADRLFGITMAEQGVSTMTTVDLETAHSMSEN